jgi:iron complex outermembrane receptor protein
MRKLYLIVLSFLYLSATAQKPDTTSVIYDPGGIPVPTPIFTLGKVVVTSSKPITATVSAQRLQNFARNDVSHALDLLPGVNVSAVGPRNESMVYVRGFDLRQTPLLLDGIPIYVPYDGYVDLARFTTFDLAEISVSKGYTSLLYGPNAMGGAINLVSRKPIRRFEVSGATGWLSGGYRSDIHIGSNLGKFYIQAGVSRLNRDSFPLSKSFKSSKNEEGGSRNNSWSRDDKVDVKLGYTPNAHSEYAVGYIYQHGTKGTPVYAGTDTLNSQYKSPRYWQWPYWNKQSVYFLSNTGIDSTQYIKTRIYWDQFRNELDSYDNATFTTITRPYAFRSIYNDYTFGGIAEYGKRLAGGRDIVKATLQYKQDVHREHNIGEPVRTMSDGTFTAGIENELKVTRALKLLTGFSFNNRASIEAQNYNSTTKTITDFPQNNNSAWNLQGGLEYQLDKDNTLTFSVARKTRFATVKDRYSYSLGTAIPNPDLRSEYTINYDLGYKTLLARWLTLESSLFYSHINNTILSVNNVFYDTVKHVWESQVQNVGRSEYLGGEIGLEAAPGAGIRVGANYTYIKMNNLSNPAIRFTNVPRNKVFGFVQYGLRDLFYIQLNGEYNSSRYNTSYGTRAGAYALFNTLLSCHVWKYFSIEGGVNNLFDRNYSLVEGYPEPGRNYFVSLRYRY